MLHNWAYVIQRFLVHLHFGPLTHTDVFSFKSLRGTATCLLWRVWHHRQQPPSLSSHWSSRGNIQMQPWLIGPEPASTHTERRTHFHSDVSPWRTHTRTHSHTQTRAGRRRSLRCRDEVQTAGRNKPIGDIIFLENRSCARRWMDPCAWNGFISAGLQCASRGPWRGLLLRRRDAFRGGARAISRGQPKINKPYDKTKLCKTLVIFPFIHSNAGGALDVGW